MQPVADAVIIRTARYSGIMYPVADVVRTYTFMKQGPCRFALQRSERPAPFVIGFGSAKYGVVFCAQDTYLVIVLPFFLYTICYCLVYDIK